MAEFTPEQQALIAALSSALGADPQIESLWLAGSLGASDGDAWSDVDLVATAPADRIAPLLAHYAATPPLVVGIVHSFTLYGRLLSAVTADWQRFDLLFVTPEELAKRDAAAHTPLFVRANATRPAGAAQTVRAAPDEELAAGVREFLRLLGLAPVMFGRAHYITGFDGAMLLRGMLIDLMLAENGRARSERSVKRVTDLLSPVQCAALVALPHLAANRESLLTYNAELAALYLPRARALLAARGLEWPEAFEAATRRWLKATLDLDI